MSESTKLLKIKPSRIGFLSNYIIIGVFGLAYLIYFLIYGYHLLVTLLVIVASTILAFETELFLLSKRWHVTPGQIFFIDGLFKKNRSGVFLATMTNVEVKQNALQRFLNVGAVEVHGFGQGGPTIIPAVKDPEKIADEIERIVRTNIGRQQDN